MKNLMNNHNLRNIKVFQFNKNIKNTIKKIINNKYKKKKILKKSKIIRVKKKINNQNNIINKN